MRMTESERQTGLAIKAAMATVQPKISVLKLAQTLGVSPNRLAHITQLRTPATPAEVAAIRKALGMPSGWPFPSGRPDGAMPGEVVSLSGVPLVELPIVGSVSAGPGLRNVDSERRRVKVPASLASVAQVGMIVEGDSMMPLLEENDTACFAERHRAIHGYPFLVSIPDEGEKIKMTFFERGDWYLASLNEKYARQLYPDGAQIMGLLVGYYRIRGTREIVMIDAAGLVP